jgi:hypothetical protein
MAMTFDMKHAWLAEADLIAQGQVVQVEASADDARVEVRLISVIDQTKSAEQETTHLQFSVDLVVRGAEPMGDCYVYGSDLREGRLLELYLMQSPEGPTPWHARYVFPVEKTSEHAQYLAGLESQIVTLPPPGLGTRFMAWFAGLLR